MVVGGLESARTLFYSRFRLAAVGDLLGIALAVCPSTVMAGVVDVDLRALLDGSLRQRNLGGGAEYRAPDGRGADVNRIDLRGDVVDRYAFQISLAGGLGRRRLSTASRTQFALRLGHRLLGIAGF